MPIMSKWMVTSTICRRDITKTRKTAGLWPRRTLRVKRRSDLCERLCACESLCTGSSRSDLQVLTATTWNHSTGDRTQVDQCTGVVRCYRLVIYGVEQMSKISSVPLCVRNSPIQIIWGWSIWIITGLYSSLPRKLHVAAAGTQTLCRWHVLEKRVKKSNTATNRIHGVVSSSQKAAGNHPTVKTWK